MDSIMQDLRYACRALVRSPGFTLAALLTLALGIGANTAMFSILRAVVLRPLPYPDGNRLVRAYLATDGGRSTVSPPDFFDWRAQNHVFTDAAGYYGTSYTMTGLDAAQRVAAATATAGFFNVLGTPPAHGRVFVPGDEVPGHNRVVVLSDAFWRDRFAADAGIIGRPLMLDGVSYTIIGVMPPGFAYPGTARLWTALAFTPDDLATQRGALYLSVVARLRSGVTIEQADRDLAAIATRLAAEYPNSNPGSTARVLSLHEVLVGPVQFALYLLLGAVGLVLAIACTNVANLLLARALAREGELAVRAAMGASRSRLARALIVESLVLGVAGGGAGILLAWWGAGLVARAQPADLPRIAETSLDSVVLAFAVALAIVTSLVFGTVPALQASRQHNLSQRLKATGRGPAGRHEARRTRNVLVVAQVGLAVVLLVGAGVLLRSFVKLRTVDLGFEPEGVLTFSVSLPDASYPTPAQADVFYTSLIERLKAAGGPSTLAGGVSVLPISGNNYSISVNHVDGTPFSTADAPSVQVRIVMPEYFRAMGMSIQRGRELFDTDRAGAPLVALVNESAGRLLWQDRNPVGHRFEIDTRFRLGGARGGGEVVGVVRDFRDEGVSEPARPTVFLAHHQFPLTDLVVVVRSPAKPEALVATIRSTLAALDSHIPLYATRSMPDVIRRNVAEPRLYLWLVAGFAATAVALAGLGVYAVIAYGVRQRTRELGIRIAMGAARRDILGLVVGSGMRLAGIGIAVGLLAAAGGGRLLEWALASQFPDTHLLYQTEPTDLASVVAAACLFALVAVAASYVPARRAAGVEPVTALRQE